MGSFLYSSPESGSYCQNNFGNAVPMRSRWKRSLWYVRPIRKNEEPQHRNLTFREA